MNVEMCVFVVDTWNVVVGEKAVGGASPNISTRYHTGEPLVYIKSHFS